MNEQLTKHLIAAGGLEAGANVMVAVDATMINSVTLIEDLVGALTVMFNTFGLGSMLLTQFDTALWNSRLFFKHDLHQLPEMQWYSGGGMLFEPVFQGARQLGYRDVVVISDGLYGDRDLDTRGLNVRFMIIGERAACRKLKSCGTVQTLYSLAA